MVKTKGAKDLKKRKSRSDKGKRRKFYAGNPISIHSYKYKNFKKYYGKDEEFTELVRERARRSTSKYYNKNKKRIQKKRWIIIKSNPENQIKERLRKSVQIMFRNYTKTGKIMTSLKYGIDYKKIIEHLKPFPRNIKDYHIDHIRPLCSFEFINEDGSTNLEEVKKALTPENLQWLKVQENLSKNGKWTK